MSDPSTQETSLLDDATGYAEQAYQSVADTAQQAYDYTADTAQQAYDYTADTAQQAYDYTADTAQQAYDYTVDTAQQAYDYTADTAQQAYDYTVDTAQQAYDYTVDTAQQAYDDTTEAAGELTIDWSAFPNLGQLGRAGTLEAWTSAAGIDADSECFFDNLDVVKDFIGAVASVVAILAAPGPVKAAAVVALVVAGYDLVRSIQGAIDCYERSGHGTPGALRSQVEALQGELAQLEALAA